LTTQYAQAEVHQRWPRLLNDAEDYGYRRQDHDSREEHHNVTENGVAALSRRALIESFTALSRYRHLINPYAHSIALV